MIKEIDTLVVGAGVAGLASACWLKSKNKEFIVVEGNKMIPENLHNGVHYLHSVPELPFETDLREVTLTDGILSDGKIYHEPNLLFSLEYSEKVREIQHPSSIMDIGKRKSVFMPKSNSMNELLIQMYEYSGMENYNFGWWLYSIDISENRAVFKNGEGLEFQVRYKNMISSVPLDIFRPMVNIKFINELQLDAKSVYVTNFIVNRIVPNWLINLYVPSKFSPIYRASLLNGLCSVESTKELDSTTIDTIKSLLPMFDIEKGSEVKYTWKTGKVSSISIDDREKVVDMLKEINIFQIGRFGLWNRKLLVDSTVKQAKTVVEYLSGYSYWDITKKSLSK